MSAYDEGSHQREVERLLQRLRRMVDDLRRLERTGAGEVALARQRGAIDRLHWRLAGAAGRLTRDRQAA